MNILFIYEFGDESWSTPQSLIDEFKSLGHEVERSHLTKPIGLNLNQVKEFKPEMVIVMDWKGLGISSFLEMELKKLGCFLVRENGDCPQNYDRHLAVSKGYDLLLTPDYISCEKYKEAGYNCIFQPHFADTKIHKQYKGLDFSPPVRSTRGPGSSFILDSLSQIMPEKFLNKNGMTGVEYGSFLNNGKITVQHSRFGEWTRRIPEGMATGTLVLTDRLPKETRIEECYVDGEDIVYYDSLTDAVSKINYYLSNNGELSRIAVNGMNKTLQHHTQVQRVQQILKCYELWKMK